MRLIYMLKLSVIFFLISFGAFSAENPPIKNDTETAPDKVSLSLSEAIKTAIKNNPSLKQLYYSKKISESDVGIAKSDKYPMVDLDMGSGISNEKTIHAGSTTAKSADVSLSLSYLLYDFGAREASIQSAKDALEAVNFTYNAKAMDLVFDVVNAYYSLLKYKDESEAAKINLEKTKLTFDIASKKYELGLVALNDKLQAETQYLTAKLNLNKALSSEKIARGGLLLLLNMAPTDEISVKLPEKQIKDNIIEGDILELIDRAIKSRYEIASKKAELRHYFAEEEVAKKSDLPSISLTSGVGSGIENVNYEKKSYSGSIGIKLTVPLFTGYKSTYNIRQKREQYNQANEELEEVISSIKESVWSSWQDYLTTKENYDVSHQLFASAEENERVAMGAYQAGKGSMLNLITAQSDLIDARNEKTASLYNFLIARSKLLKEIGFNDVEGFN